MQMHCRELTSADCPRVAEFLARAAGRGYSTEAITRQWPLLLEADSLKCVVVESSGGELVTVGASLFVEDSFVRDLVAGGGPLIGARLLDSAGAARSAVSTMASIGRANASSGLNVFILHSGLIEVPHSHRSEIPAIKVKLMTGFMALHAGYNINQLLVEAFGEEERSMYVDGSSFLLLNDYADQLDAAWCDLGRPYLVGLTRADVAQMHMHPLLPFFQQYPPPVFFFARAERTLLRRAMEGGTDEAFALDLGVPVSAVKQRWVRLFSRVHNSGGRLFADDPVSEQRSTRGLQKRHILLRYLRAHPEELAPYSPTTARSHKGGAATAAKAKNS
jgi:hypothetical protein